MSTSTPKNPADNEEIDLGILFNAIGKGISKFFSVIFSAIHFVLNTLLALVVFIRKRIVYYALAAAVGLVIGVVLENATPNSYFASATVEPHFESARQLYSNIEYLNDLAKQQDSVQLATFFDLPFSEASSIKEISITPFRSETQLLKAYNSYVTSLDSLVATETSYEKYLKQLDKYDTNIHIISIESTKQDVFSQLLDPLISSVANQPYFIYRQKTELNNLEQSDSITQISIVQTDSLLNTFKEVKLLEAKKVNSNGTNVIMSESKENNAELALLERKILLSDRLEDIRNAKIEASSVIEIISAFPPVGYLSKSIWGKKWVQGALGGIGLISLFYLMLHLDSFLLGVSQKD